MCMWSHAISKLNIHFMWILSFKKNGLTIEVQANACCFIYSYMNYVYFVAKYSYREVLISRI